MLQETRTRVLRHAGFDVDLAGDSAEVEKRMTDRRYEMLLVCHSVPEEEVSVLKAIELQTGVATYWIEPLTPPEALIADIKARLQGREKLACGSEEAGGASKATA